jgi:hypothetical protein
MTRIARPALGLVLAFGGLLAFQGTARAQECPASCVVQKRACVRAGRVTMLSCREACRDSSDPTARGTCMRSCASSFRTAKRDCRSDQAGCREACAIPPGPPPPHGCIGSCGQELATCVRDVSVTMRACVGECRTMDDRRGCGADCAAAVSTGMAACRSTFEACKAACGGSPSGAFLVD